MEARFKTLQVIWGASLWMMALARPQRSEAGIVLPGQR